MEDDHPKGHDKTERPDKECTDSASKPLTNARRGPANVHALSGIEAAGHAD